MSGQVVDELRTRPPVPGNSSAADDGENDVTSLLNNEAVVISSTLALCVGLIQVFYEKMNQAKEKIVFLCD